MEELKNTPQGTSPNTGKGFIRGTVDKLTGKLSDKISENVYGFVTRVVKAKFGVELYFDDYNLMDFRLAEGWLYKKDPDKYNANTKKLYLKKPKEGEIFTRDLNKCSYLIKLEEETATFCHVKCLEYENERKEISKGIFIYVFGKKYKKYLNELIKEISGFTKKSDKLCVMKCSEKNGGWPYTYRIDKRDFSTIFLDKDTKSEIIKYVHKWKANKELFTSRGLNYKSGILLHGEPGTGKTSIAKALAVELDCILLIIDVNAISKVSVMDALRTASEESPSGTVVVLLEDIDCIVGKREGTKKDKMTEDEKKALNTMLQLLDGVNEVSNVIFVATTNHYENLDWALIRPSRFDIKPEIGKLSREVAVEMCNSFKVDPDIILSKDLKLINPSELQDKIIKHIMDVAI